MSLQSQTRTGYTHLVKFVRIHAGVARVRGQYRTTSDAVEIHRKALQQGIDSGRFESFSIEPPQVQA